MWCDYFRFTSSCMWDSSYCKENRQHLRSSQGMPMVEGITVKDGRHAADQGV